VTIVYCDWTSGNDSTGDGSAGNPYKTITTASSGLSGGDEVRVAKSPAHTALSETLSWTDNSASVGTTGDLTGELSAGDMIGKNADDGMWWEISAINSTTITLTGVYSGTTETVTSYKLGFHDCGSPASTNTQVQAISASGSSVSSKLKISGGWDLTSQTVTGVSAFCCTHSSNRYGYGLYGAVKDYVDIENLIFCRFYDNIYIGAGSDYLTLTSIVSCAPGRRAIDLSGNFGNIVSLKCCFGVTTSTNGCVFNGQGLNIGSLLVGSFSGSTSYHAISSNCNDLFISGTLNCRNTTNYCFTAYGELIASEMVFANCGRVFGDLYSSYYAQTFSIGKLTVTGATLGVYFSRYAFIKIGSYVPSGNTAEWLFGSTYLAKCQQPIVAIQRWNDTEGDSRLIYYNGEVRRDTADARSGACVKAIPTSETYYIQISLGKYLITATGSDITLTIYAKDDAAFNGDVELMALVNGVVAVEWTAKTMATSYGAHTLTVPSASLVENEWIELIARARGTAGAVYFDDFSAS
jgi:hypothetical protein